jgi:hypothetical protein
MDVAVMWPPRHGCHIDVVERQRRRVCQRLPWYWKILSVCLRMRIVTKMRWMLTTHRMASLTWRMTPTLTGGDGSLSSPAASPRLGFASGCFPAIDRLRRTRRRALARPQRRPPGATPSRQGRTAPRGEGSRPRSRQRRNHPPRRRRRTRPPRSTRPRCRPRRLISARAGTQVPRPTRRAGRAARRARSCSACSPASPATLRASCPASACTPSRRPPPPARSATDRARCISS